MTRRGHFRHFAAFFTAAAVALDVEGRSFLERAPSESQANAIQVGGALERHVFSAVPLIAEGLLTQGVDVPAGPLRAGRLREELPAPERRPASLRAFVARFETPCPSAGGFARGARVAAQRDRLVGSRRELPVVYARRRCLLDHLQELRDLLADSAGHPVQVDVDDAALELVDRG